MCYSEKYQKINFSEVDIMKHLNISTRSLSSLVKDINKNKFDFDHPFQRKSGQWNRTMMSDLIDSAIRYYPLLPVLVEEYDDGRYGVIDGKQRLTILASYFNNEFALHKSSLPVNIDDKSYELAGRKYKEKPQKIQDTKSKGRKSKYLDEEVRDRLESIEIQIYIMKDPTEDDIREIFARINCSKGLTNTQKRTVYESPELAKIIYELKSHPVLEKLTTQVERNKDLDKDIIRQTLMLIEMSNEYDFGSFRNNDINKFILRYNDNINYDKIKTLTEAMDAMNLAFEEIPVTRITAPMLLYGYYRITKDKKGMQKWNDWVKNFLETYETNEEYKKYCNGSGTASAEMVKGRLQYFRNAVRTI